MLHTFFPSYFHWWHIPFLFAAGLTAESYASLIGGGSFITQPALLLLGVPLQSALAIDASAPLATEFGILSETLEKVRQNKKLVLFIAIPTTLGGAMGTWLLLTVPVEVIRYIMVASIMIVLMHSFMTQNKPKTHRINRANYALLFLFLFVVAIYGNFIGLGEGTFGRMAMMSVLGLSFIQSQGIKSTATIPSRIYSLVVTGIAGLIVWPYLLTFFCSHFIAGKYATKFVKKIPDQYLKIGLTIVSILFVIYLLFFY